MARTKLKKKRGAEWCTNHVRNDRCVSRNRRISKHADLLHQDNFDAEDQNYDSQEYGISIKSYKAGGDIYELNQNMRKLNKGKPRKNRRVKLSNGISITTMVLRDLMEDFK